MKEIEYISVKEAAQRWKVSERRVHQYCKEDRIPGLQRFGNAWAIPEDAIKPSNPRKKKTVYKSNKNRLEVSKKNKIGAVIAAAGKFDEEEGISPFMKLGAISLIRRIVLVFRQAQVDPIVVITGYQAFELEHHLASYGVIFIHNENYEKSDKFMSLKLGLEFMQDKCDKVFFSSLGIPMVMPETLRKMALSDSLITAPSFENKNGHPLLIDAQIIPAIINYQGTGGMKGALEATGVEKEYMHVEDEGILLSIENISRLEDSLPEYNEHLLHPFVNISIEKEVVFFDARAKLLLFLIQEFHSVQGACKQMAISKGKAWDMIIKMEEELGVTIVQRQQGGRRERKTTLTPEGKLFLEFYTKYEEEVKKFAVQKFEEMYSGFKEGISLLDDSNKDNKYL